MEEIKNKVMEFFHLKEDEISFLGSTGKKLVGGTSGDIDLAISKKALQEQFDINTEEEWFDLANEFG